MKYEFVVEPGCSDAERLETQLVARQTVTVRELFKALQRESNELRKMTRHQFKVPRRH